MTSSSRSLSLTGNNTNGVVATTNSKEIVQLIQQSALARRKKSDSENRVLDSISALARTMTTLQEMLMQREEESRREVQACKRECKDLKETVNHSENAVSDLIQEMQQTARMIRYPQTESTTSLEETEKQVGNLANLDQHLEFVITHKIEEVLKACTSLKEQHKEHTEELQKKLQNNQTVFREQSTMQLDANASTIATVQEVYQFIRDRFHTLTEETNKLSENCSLLEETSQKQKEALEEKIENVFDELEKMRRETTKERNALWTQVIAFEARLKPTLESLSKKEPKAILDLCDEIEKYTIRYGKDLSHIKEKRLEQCERLMESCTQKRYHCEPFFSAEEIEHLEEKEQILAHNFVLLHRLIINYKKLRKAHPSYDAQKEILLSLGEKLGPLQSNGSIQNLLIQKLNALHSTISKSLKEEAKKQKQKKVDFMQPFNFLDVLASFIIPPQPLGKTSVDHTKEVARNMFIKKRRYILASVENDKNCQKMYHKMQTTLQRYAYFIEMELDEDNQKKGKEHLETYKLNIENPDLPLISNNLPN